MISTRTTRAACLGAALAALAAFTPARAGNVDRIGQAGATELLLNPWARSSGWAGLNSASIYGIESERINIAGLAYRKGAATNELSFNYTNWLQGSGVNLTSFGYARALAGEAVLGISFMSVGFGEIPVTTYLQPESGAGTYRPTFFNLGISYAKKFTDNIYGGVLLRLVSQSIPDASAQGIAFDAGIQYHLPELPVKFGISLRNVGTPMRFSGEGLAYRGNAPNSSTSPSGEYTITVQQRAERFELPSLMNIGVSYDILEPDTASGNVHGLSAVANFTSNSFSRDQYGLGLEYRYRDWFAVRSGYAYQAKATSASDRTSALTGFAAGATLQAPLVRERGILFGLDYSYRASNPFAGSHSIGARLIF